MINVLNLKNTESRKYFLRKENYVNFDLPDYFEFSPLLKDCLNLLEKIPLSNYHLNKAKSEENVNYVIFKNKDGKYGWRPLQIVNPMLYISLLQNITEKDNWNSIVNRFDQFTQESWVNCISIPVAKKNSYSYKANQILNWWENFEQESIIQGLDFSHMFETDITDCYGSLYSHSISWALHDKEYIKQKANRNNPKLIGNIIDTHIQSMSYGQTNGIPQGSVIMDFIAEMVLGYADMLLTKKIKSRKINKDDFKIIRYRDDYRVFVNSIYVGETLLKDLLEVLISLGIKLNTSKTRMSEDVIANSIKKDKLYFLLHPSSHSNLKKELLKIYLLNEKHPNSGTIVRTLTSLYKIQGKRHFKKEDVDVIISILVNIALKSPRSYPIIAAMISQFSEKMNPEDKKILVSRILARFSQIPNTGYLEIWLQRICLGIDIPYKEEICRMVQNENNNVVIWNMNWLEKKDYKIDFERIIIDEKKLKRTPNTITQEEVDLFFRNFY
ncbi:MAG: RNA-directed DNA polymerase [bacterium]